MTFYKAGLTQFCENARSIWLEIITPSASDELPYYQLLIAVGHAVLAGACVELIGLPWVVAGVYILAKETPDVVWRGGSLRDSIHDSAFVLIGCGAATGSHPFALIIGAAAVSAVIWRR